MQFSCRQCGRKRENGKLSCKPWQKMLEHVCNFFYCQKKHTSTMPARLFEKLPYFHGPTTQSLKTVAAIARPKRIPHSCGTLPIFSLSNTNADLMEERPYYSRKVLLLCIASLMQGQSATKSRRTPYHCALLHTSTPS